MQVYATPMRRMGLALPRKEISRSEGVRGDVRVTCIMDSEMGRATNTEEIIAGPGMQEHPLPALRDARLSGMSTVGFVLTGFETVDGRAYAQSWWCRL